MRASLAAAMAALALAIGFVVAAMVANGSIFFSGTSPGWMGAAAAATAVAVASLIAARALVESYYNCLRSLGLVGSDCDGKLRNLLRTLEALILAVGIQVGGCLAAAGVSWIPLLGLAPMTVVVGALAAQLALIPTVFVFLADLRNCLPPPPAPPTSPLASITGPLEVFGFKRAVVAPPPLTHR